MKVRNGFVSNSSSSSFIFAIPKSYNGKIKLTLTVDLKELGDICKTQKEVTKHLLDNYGYTSLKALFKDFPNVEKHYEACLKQLQEDNVIAMGTVSNEGSDGVEYILTGDSWTIEDPRVKQIGEISW